MGVLPTTGGPLTQLVVVGFSLGGNIVCKYLGETQANQEKVLCCVSVCQGYSALRLVILATCSHFLLPLVLQLAFIY